MRQKVVSVNVNTMDVHDKGYYEMEFDKVNKYIAEGYVVVDTFSTVCNQAGKYVNITFILEKLDKMDESSYLSVPFKGGID